jgi:cytochrome c-type biogenesis protein CcmH
MSTFLLVAFLMVALGVLLISRPLLRPTARGHIDVRSQNVDIAREAISELEQNLADGLIQKAKFEVARDEIERNLLEDTSIESGGPAQDNLTQGRVALLVILILLPAFTWLLYQKLGSPQLISTPPMAQGVPANGMDESIDPNNPAQMVELLNQRIAEDPSDPKGWYLLGRVYISMGKYTEAVEALEKLRELSDDHPVSLVALADALSMKNEGKIEGRALELVLLALENDPENTTALWMAGTAAQERSDYQNAIYYWRRAEAGLAERPEYVVQLRGLIEEVKLAATEARLEVEDPGTSLYSPPAVSIDLEVQLAASLKEKIQPGAVLFVFAKVPGGPPMPIAAARKQIDGFPIRVAINDEALLGSQLSLTDFEKLEIRARVSMSGQAIAQSGDLQSDSLIVGLSDELHQLTINQQIP